MLQSHAWKKSGQITLWRFTEHDRNFPGWHLTADAAGCASLVALVDAIATDGAPASRVFEVASPTDRILAVPNNRPGRAVWTAPARLRLTFSAEPSHWHFPATGDPVVLTIGADWLPQLREGIDGIPRGLGDYSIGNSENGSLPLWFWWQLRST